VGDDRTAPQWLRGRRRVNDLLLLPEAAWEQWKRHVQEFLKQLYEAEPLSEVQREACLSDRLSVRIRMTLILRLRLLRFRLGTAGNMTSIRRRHLLRRYDGFPRAAL